ncbi:MAG: hypothetical protein KME23_26355 [Goleter apudmare HA4340-LM2]|jgi:hypothetical protein|nr:hypothetical protein [Goleter apudmare HA4340-LM2]
MTSSLLNITQHYPNLIWRNLRSLCEWRKYLTLTDSTTNINSPYIIGIPVTPEQEIFTGRNNISKCIEQLLLDHRHIPLLLYGQRRMGKTSLLNNLGRLLPNNIIPMFVDLQGAATSACKYTGFLYHIAKDMVNSAQTRGLILPPLTREVLAANPCICFHEWLDQVEILLGDSTALLALDEFEVLDNAISKGCLHEQDVLGMLRHLIQHRPHFQLLLAGSHTLAEYQRWANYLTDVQVVHLSYLSTAAARRLIEHPVKDFYLYYKPDAVEQILQLTRCHPFLVQLICAEIIALKNEQVPSMRRVVTVTDVEAAIPLALSSGSFFFADIQNNQVDSTGLAILHHIAVHGEGAIVFVNPDIENTLNLLLQRELIEKIAGGYRFQVELIRRWFETPLHPWVLNLCVPGHYQITTGGDANTSKQKR